jgi:hypothetical protein
MARKYKPLYVGCCTGYPKAEVQAHAERLCCPALGLGRKARERHARGCKVCRNENGNTISAREAFWYFHAAAHQTAAETADPF